MSPLTIARLTSHTMARITDRFPDGTEVGVYPRVARNPSSGGPAGAQITSAKVADDAVTFSGLQVGTDYTAHAEVAGEHRYVNFRAKAA
jgi:hypothetical protein